VHAAVEARLAGIEERRQTIAVALPERPVRIVADPARFAQVLDNLLANARKFTPEGGAIRVEVEALAEAVELRVIDSGIGIPPGEIDRLFELFHQLDATLDRAQGGLGIGLALVKRLVELHGGSVRADSAGPGQGSTFTVRWPTSAAG
jgi:signal transduction histidine kinase